MYKKLGKMEDKDTKRQFLTYCFLLHMKHESSELLSLTHGVASFWGGYLLFKIFVLIVKQVDGLVIQTRHESLYWIK